MSKADQERVLWWLAGLTLWILLGSVFGWLVSVAWDYIGGRLGHE